MQLIDRLSSAGTDAYKRLNNASGGVLDILKTTVQCYGKNNSPKWAASLAYYIFFSLFPLLLVLVTAASYILRLNSEQASQRAISFITEALPIEQGLVSNTLAAVVESRGALTLISLLSLTWSASGAFATLSHSINEAFQMASPRGFIKQRLVALAMVTGLIVLLLLSVAVTTILNLLPNSSIFGHDLGFLARPIGTAIARLAPVFISLVMFTVFYRWVPTKAVRWKAVFWAAGIAAIVWELAKRLFTWYIESGLASYGLVYGSLGSVVILLFWIYISASIALLGAHLAAAIDGNGKPATDEVKTENKRES